MSEDASSDPVVDMSPEAIDRRLREVGQLYRLHVEIQRSRARFASRCQKPDETATDETVTDETETDERPSSPGTGT